MWAVEDADAIEPFAQAYFLDGHSHGSPTLPCAPVSQERSSTAWHNRGKMLDLEGGPAHPFGRGRLAFPLRCFLLCFFQPGKPCIRQRR